jgi:hypothetical protein
MGVSACGLGDQWACGANQIIGGLLGLVWNKAVARINNYRAMNINSVPYRRIVEVRSFLPSSLPSARGFLIDYVRVCAQGVLIVVLTSVTIYLSSTWLSACQYLLSSSSLNT